MSSGGLIDSLVAVLGQGLLLTLWVALPLLAAALVAGVVTGLLGAVTQVQDAAISLVVRLAAMAGALLAFGPIMAQQLGAFGREVMAMLGQLGGGA